RSADATAMRRRCGEILGPQLLGPPPGMPPPRGGGRALPRRPQHPQQQAESRQTLLENGYRLKPQLHQSMGQWLPVSEEELAAPVPAHGRRPQNPPRAHEPRLQQGALYRQGPPYPSSQDRSQTHAAGAWPDCPNSVNAVPVWATSLDQPVEEPLLSLPTPLLGLRSEAKKPS
ncbi:unnamed protein product, partial [Prorocentrum cordatum]